MKKEICKLACMAALMGGVPGVSVCAQEFRANVEVNSQQVEGTNRNVFETLKEQITTYMNETKFS